MLRWVIDEQVDVLGFAVHFDQLRLEVKANLLEYDLESLDGVFIENLSSILCDEDQVNMQCKHAMSAVSNIL
jgi:hypothetical protein